MKILYQATATGGREGHVRSENGILDMEVRLPKALGGASDNYVNPEMLFAAGYASCFDSALNFVIKLFRVQAGKTVVTSKVAIGKIGNGAFGLNVKLIVNIPKVTVLQAKELAQEADFLCPYYECN